jgi:hypothetical protein
MKDLKKKAEEYLKNNKLNCSQFKGTVIIEHLDGSYFSFNSAIMEEDDNFVYVWSEHNNNHYFFKEDLQDWKIDLGQPKR